jgi:hypothetical protein
MSQKEFRKYFTLNLFIAFLTFALFSGTALCQQPSPDQKRDQNTIEGTVVSASRETLVVKTDESDFQLFVFDRYTTKPQTMAAGTRVRVVSSAGEEEGTRLANTITVLTPASDTRAESTSAQATPPPKAVRDLEQNIKSDARRWRLGVRAGAALDPELFMFGVHTQIGPVFNRNVFFRPNAEFAFGEVTDLIAVNLEAIYRLPITARGKTWSTYFGAGPALTFLHQNFERSQGQGRDIDFGNFDYDTGFNLLAGIQRRHTFFEMKTSLYAQPAPTLRLILGYNF